MSTARKTVLPKRWTKQEINRLLELSEAHAPREIVEKMPGRTLVAIRNKLHSLGVSPLNGVKTLMQLSEETGYDKKQIDRVVSKLNLRIKKGPKRGAGNRNWKITFEQEEQIIAELQREGSPEVVAERARLRRERENASKRAWYARNREAKIEKERKRREELGEAFKIKDKERARLYRQNNAEKVRAQRHAHYLENRERLLEQKKSTQSRNLRKLMLPEELKKELAAYGQMTHEQKLEIIERLKVHYPHWIEVPISRKDAEITRMTSDLPFQFARAPLPKIKKNIYFTETAAELEQLRKVLGA